MRAKSNELVLNHTGFFSVLLGIVMIGFGILNPKFEPMGVTTKWFFKDHPVPNWPFRVFYCASGVLLIYSGFRERFG